MADEDFDGALAALTHEVRVAILRELADADRPLPFSELDRGSTWPIRAGSTTIRTNSTEH